MEQDEKESTSKSKDNILDEKHYHVPDDDFQRENPEEDVKTENNEENISEILDTIGKKKRRKKIKSSPFHDELSNKACCENYAYNESNEIMEQDENESTSKSKDTLLDERHYHVPDDDFQRENPEKDVKTENNEEIISENLDTIGKKKKRKKIKSCPYHDELSNKACSENYAYNESNEIMEQDENESTSKSKDI
ncbi:uncharacterized protein LOC132755919 [Ruditapes philippinarum]|uniref:uncharacterized protein LOC132755919 n=1 Tax=Ruditapes philippinarum TaxID=129788 RepID=UPI00295B2DF7|nr:uncharacterized protein LOC132755919 [Ruditapes philippinarum]